jgi:hypothetical protein
MMVTQNRAFSMFRPLLTRFRACFGGFRPSRE